MLAAALIFLGTYLVLAVGRLPGFRVDRTGAAIIGAGLMIAFNVLTLEEAYASIDHNTIMLLFGMMIVVANLRLSGFFAAVAEWVVRHAHHRLSLLAAIVLVSGVFSAFFVNDTMCLVLTPLVLEIVLALGRNPVPYLLAVAMASNIGSVATITGNPQNMMIGVFSGIPYRQFAADHGAGRSCRSRCCICDDRLDIPKGVRSIRRRVVLECRRVRVNRVLMWKSLVASGLMILFFFIGWPIAKVAIVAGALLLITRRVKPEKIYHEIDFSLLVLFTGLFIVIAGIEKTPLPSAGPGALFPDMDWTGPRFSALSPPCCRISPAMSRPCFCLSLLFRTLPIPAARGLFLRWLPRWPATSRCWVPWQT